MVMFVMLAVVLIRSGHLQILRERSQYTYDAKDNVGELFFQMHLLIQLGGLALAAGMSRWISARSLAAGIVGCALACLPQLICGAGWPLAVLISQRE
jgi:hypothetical protein